MKRHHHSRHTLIKLGNVWEWWNTEGRNTLTNTSKRTKTPDSGRTSRTLRSRSEIRNKSWRSSRRRRRGSLSLRMISWSRRLNRLWERPRGSSRDWSPLWFLRRSQVMKSPLSSQLLIWRPTSWNRSWHWLNLSRHQVQHLQEMMMFLIPLPSSEQSPPTRMSIPLNSPVWNKEGEGTD